MPVLQLWKKEGVVTLFKGHLKEITDDPRTKMMPKDTFLSAKYKVEDGVFITHSSLIMNLATKDDKEISALYCKHKGCHIIIVPPKSYVFYNGKSFEPESYNIIGGNTLSEDEIMKQASLTVMS